MKIDSISSQRTPSIPQDRVEKSAQSPSNEKDNSVNEENESYFQFTQQDIQKKIESINKFLEPSKTSLKFQLHDKLHEYYVAIVNPTTNEVIKEVPPKKFLDMYAFMLESIGLIVDHRI